LAAGAILADTQAVFLAARQGLLPLSNLLLQLGLRSCGAAAEKYPMHTEEQFKASISTINGLKLALRDHAFATITERAQMQPAMRLFISR
jgi:hypothetical protein